MLAQHQIRSRHHSHIFRAHDFIGLAVLQHAVLMNARLVRECVCTHDRLVALHHHARQLAHQAARRKQLLRLHARLQAIVIAPHLQRHHQLFQRTIARPLADSIDRHFHPPRPALDCRQRIRHRQAQIVVAMHMHHHILQLRHMLVQIGQQPAELLRNREPHRVGNVDRGRPRRNDRANHLRQKLRLRPRRILRTELDVLAELARIRHTLHRLPHNLVLRLFQLELAVNRTRRQKHMDPRTAPRRFQGRRTLLDVALHAPRQSGNAAFLDFRGHLFHRLEIAWRRRRKSRLDDVHIQFLQLPRHLQLLVDAHARPRTLLPVAQRGVENNHMIRLLHIPVIPSSTFLHLERGQQNARQT